MSKYQRPEFGDKCFGFNSLLMDIERMIQYKRVNLVNWIQIRKIAKKNLVELVFRYKKHILSLGNWNPQKYDFIDIQDKIANFFTLKKILSENIVDRLDRKLDRLFSLFNYDNDVMLRNQMQNKSKINSKLDSQEDFDLLLQNCSLELRKMVNLRYANQLSCFQKRKHKNQLEIYMEFRGEEICLGQQKDGVNLFVVQYFFVKFIKENSGTKLHKYKSIQRMCLEFLVFQNYNNLDLKQTDFIVILNYQTKQSLSKIIHIKINILSILRDNNNSSYINYYVTLLREFRYFTRQSFIGQSQLFIILKDQKYKFIQCKFYKEIKFIGISNNMKTLTKIQFKLFEILKKEAQIRIDQQEELIFKLSNLTNLVKNKDKVTVPQIDLENDIIDLDEEEDMKFTDFEQIVQNLNILMIDRTYSLLSCFRIESHPKSGIIIQYKCHDHRRFKLIKAKSISKINYKFLQRKFLQVIKKYKVFTQTKQIKLSNLVKFQFKTLEIVKEEITIIEKTQNLPINQIKSSIINAKEKEEEEKGDTCVQKIVSKCKQYTIIYDSLKAVYQSESIQGIDLFRHKSIQVKDQLRQRFVFNRRIFGKNYSCVLQNKVDLDYERIYNKFAQFIMIKKIWTDSENNMLISLIERILNKFKLIIQQENFKRTALKRSKLEQQSFNLIQNGLKSMSDNDQQQLINLFEVKRKDLYTDIYLNHPFFMKQYFFMRVIDETNIDYKDFQTKFLQIVGNQELQYKPELLKLSKIIEKMKN